MERRLGEKSRVTSFFFTQSRVKDMFRFHCAVSISTSYIPHTFAVRSLSASVTVHKGRAGSIRFTETLVVKMQEWSAEKVI